MKRMLKIVGVAGSVVLLGLIVAVNMIAADSEIMQAPDPAMVITLPSGESERLDTLVAAYLAPEGAPPGVGAGEDAGEKTTAAVDEGDSSAHEPRFAAEAALEQAVEFLAVLNEQRRAPASDLYSLAEWHRHGGQIDQAEALYASIPEGHPQWSRARRRLAWDVYTKGHGQPGRGVPLAHQSLRSDPLDGNAWQDAARVYLATLGLPVD